MIAQVYPIKRLPRRFSVFDYEAPEGMELSRGMMVRVPFRGGMIFGIVAKTCPSPNAPRKLKQVAGIISGITLREEELAFFESCAFDLAQSVPSLLHAVLPRPPERRFAEEPPSIQRDSVSIPGREAGDVKRVIGRMREHDRMFVNTPDLRRACAIILSWTLQERDPIVIIAPTVRDARIIASHLAPADPALITGDETRKRRYEAWLAFRNGSRPVLVGTRQAAFLTREHIGAVFVVRSGHDQHKQHDRNPRFDARRIVLTRTQASRAKIVFMDTHPRPEDFETFSVHEHCPPLPTPSCSALNREGAAAPHYAVASETFDGISAALARGKTVLCAYNRKGDSRRLACDDCPYVAQCPSCASGLRVHDDSLRCHRCGHEEPMPLSCPGCQGAGLRKRGLGNAGMRRVLSTLFPDASVAILDKDHERIDRSADIVLTTNYYLENAFDPFTPSKIGLVVLMDADAPLFEPTFRALEHALGNLSAWRGVAYAHRTPLRYQTKAPDIFERFLTEPASVWREELAMRESYGYPPAKRWMRVTWRANGTRSAPAALDELAAHIKTAAPSATLVRAEKGLEIALEPSDLPSVLTLFSTLDDRYIIDTNAYS